MRISPFISSAILYCILATPFYLLGRWIWRKVRRVPFAWKREMLMLVFFEFVTVFISQTLLPMVGWRYFLDHLGQIPYHIGNYVLFRTIGNYWKQIGQGYASFNIVANILITVPFGILLPILWEKFRKFWRVFVHCSILIIAIELLQPFVWRACDIDDYILNICGVIMGYGIWKYLNFVSHRATE